MAEPGVVLEGVGDWISRYLKYTEEHEGPLMFHYWAAVSVIAGALERKVWIKRGYENIHPNMYILFVGPPGRARKSASANIGINVLETIKTVSLAADKTSTEALLRALETSKKDSLWSKEANKMFTHSSLTVWSREFGLLAARKELERGLSQVLIELYDCPKTPHNPIWTYDIIGRTPSRIPMPCLNILGCTTPKWVAKNFSMEIEEGLPSRFIYVFEENKRHKDPLELVPESRLSLFAQLSQELMVIHKLTGEFTMTRAALARYAYWYKDEEEGDRKTSDERFGAYYERKPRHLLKLSIIHAAARGGKEVDERDINRSLVVLGLTEEKMVKALGIGSDQLNVEVLQKVNKIIYEHGDRGVKRSTLGHAVFRLCPLAKDLDVVIDSLYAMGRIHIQQGRPIRYTRVEGMDPDMDKAATKMREKDREG